MRKIVGQPSAPATPPAPGALDIGALALVLVTSEDPRHPIENAFDGQHGPGATEWVAAEPGAQSVTVVFDEPHDVRAISIEIEERVFARTQEIEVAISTGSGAAFQGLVTQEYNFSPPSTSFERETWTVARRGVSHVRITVRPDKGGAGEARARLTGLVIYAP